VTIEYLIQDSIGKHIESYTIPLKEEDFYSFIKDLLDKYPINKYIISTRSL